MGSTVAQALNSTVGRVVAGVGTAGLSEVGREASLVVQKNTGNTTLSKAAGIAGGSGVTGSNGLLTTGSPSLVGSSAGAGAAAATALLSQKMGGPPAAGSGPVAPTLDDAAKQAALDEQKRAAGMSPSPITNINGARGILTDPNAKYVKGQLLGGA
jgi:hypothetical protein